MNESKQHRLLKEFSKEVLSNTFEVPEQFIYEEFALNDIIYDVAAFPPAELNELTSVGVECGNKKTNWKKNHEHFKKCLQHIDLIVWFPYSIFKAPFRDLLLMQNTEDLNFVPVNYNIDDEAFQEVTNTPEGDTICGLLVSKRGRYEWFDKHWQRQNNEFV